MDRTDETEQEDTSRENHQTEVHAINEILELGNEIAKVGFFSYQGSTDQVYWTREIRRILEVEEDALDQHLESYLPLVHKDFQKLLVEANEKIRRRETYEIEYKILTGSGKEKYLREKTALKTDIVTRDYKIFGYIQDITEEKNKERYHSSLKDNLMEAKGNASIGSWKYDVIHDEYMGTDEMYEIYGVPRSETSEDFGFILERIHPEDRKALEEAKRENLEGRSHRLSYRILSKGGSVKYVTAASEPVMDGEGRVVAIIGTLQDMSENRLLEEKLLKNVELLKKAEALAHIGSWESDLLTGASFWSAEACRIFGLPEDAAENSISEFKSYVHPEDMHLVDDVLLHPRKGPMELEVRIIRRDGEIAHIYETVEYVFDDQGNPTHIYGIIQDITEKVMYRDILKKKEEDIQKISRKYDALIMESADVFEILDECGTIQYISNTSERITGFSPQEKLGKSIFTYYEPEEVQKLQEMLKTVLDNPRKKVVKDIRYVSKEGKTIYLEFIMLNFLEDSAVNGIVVNYRDVTNRVRYENKILHLSTHDLLTGLPNKRHFDKEIQKIKKRAGEGHGFALIMLDIENEEYIKDNLGYMVLEEFIRSIAQKIELHASADIYLCRYSENRFILVVEEGQNMAYYEQVVSGIYEIFREPILVRKYELDVEISCGISIFSNADTKEESLVKQAETALFMAKSEGKNRIKYYSSDFDILSYKQFVLRTDLMKSINSRQLRLVFQPIVGLDNGEVLGAEVLIRWEHPEWGLISPVEFIALAEETGYIIQIGKWVLEEACRYYKAWLTKGLHPIKISINFSSIQFFEPDFVKNLLDTLQRFGLSPEFLIMEITENILITETDKIVEDLKKLKAHGIKIALDDFGTGYSSLSYLASLSIDILKIDGQFIRKINIDEASTVITRHIIRIAQDLNIRLVAERLETWEQLDFLRKLNCYTGQGYLYSPPVNPEGFEEILSRRFMKPSVLSPDVVLEERRRFFRLQFRELLEATLSIVAIGGRDVEVGNTKVLMRSIGPGGLCFISNIRLPVDKKLILQFNTELSGEKIHVQGHVVWSSEIHEHLFEYGIEFSCPEDRRREIQGLLTRVQTKMKNDHLFAEGPFVSGTPDQYFNRR